MKYALSILVALMVVLYARPALAAGTISGTIKGPHGQTSVVAYKFTNNSTGQVVSGSTGSDGTFSQSLDNGSWKFTAIAPTEYQYTKNIEIPVVKVVGDASFNMGIIPFHFEVPDGAADDINAGHTLPPECSVSGEPVIIRAYYTDEAKGEFLYTGRSAGITVVTDLTGYTVTADYSILEGQQPGTVVEAATDNGNHTYTITRTVTNTTKNSGGVVIITVSNGGSSTTTCLDGPVNLDIRSFFSGGDTTDFSSVSDFRSIQNFTMHQDGVMKVKFRKAVNMLDRTVQRFMQNIASKMVTATGKVNLDAKAVLELKNAGAEITLYNLPYKFQPTILLDDSDPGTAIGDVTYDAVSGTLVFNAAHFSEYKAVPSITLSLPEDKTTTTDDKILVKGTVADISATVTIKVGGVDQGTVTVGPDGVFSKEVSLATGSNTIVVDASNSIGSATDVARTVTRQSLPATGIDTLWILGALVLLSGGVLVRFRAKRLAA